MSAVEPLEDDELELALARLEWARAAASCLELPAQREALEWHLACWESALAAFGGPIDRPAAAKGEA